uniref:Uncharacterized protein n=1 Tax=Sinocyclocheilus anshuiensis TaxID=1608454 RepID=A0A671ME84_9TELE
MIQHFFFPLKFGEMDLQQCQHRLIFNPCVLANLTFAKQGQKKICDTSLMISNDFHASLDEDAKGNGNIHNLTQSQKQMIHLIPQVIFEAQCNSEYCTLPNGVDMRLNSLPIYQEILVLKQDTEDRKCFKATFERVIVGCTCVWAKTS